MIDYQFNGLPLHVLLVHFIVIMVPLAALCLLLSAFWPAARNRLGFIVASVHWLWHFLALPGPRWLRFALTVVFDSGVVVTAVGSVVAVVLVGESGTAAVWTGSFG